jgi:site-specific DNA-methyltransferase (adenine-specific)
MAYNILSGDCLEQLRTIPDNSFDGSLTDPPYALQFMGKDWDKTLPPVEVWSEVLRVLKPGAYLLAFGGTRTFHRLACNIEDAGFQIRDCLQWLHGQGFPKSLDISKAIDKRAGAKREVVGAKVYPDGTKAHTSSNHHQGYARPFMENPHWQGDSVTAPATPQAEQWNGYGTALKPAWEPILLCQKPIEGTYAENALRWGCGGLDIDGCRIGIASGDKCIGGAKSANGKGEAVNYGAGGYDGTLKENKSGRFPANVLLSHHPDCKQIGCAPDCPVRQLDEQSGQTKSPSTYVRKADSGNVNAYGQGIGEPEGTVSINYGDTGGASRFFYQFHPDCPVRLLDQQTAELKGAVSRTPSDAKGVTGFGAGNNLTIYGDTGGASRFYWNCHPDCILCGNPSADNYYKEWKHTYAKNAAKHLETIRPIIGNTAPDNAQMKAVERIAHNVSCAESLCGRCATSIALNLVATKIGNTGLLPLLDYITDYKRCTLIQNLASFAEMWGSIDTIPTTQSLTLLFGCVNRATTNYTPETSGYAPTRFRYCSKASRKEREAGLETQDLYNEANPQPDRDNREQRQIVNNHPTVKPLALCRYLATLILPPARENPRRILVPYSGSGSEILAALQAGWEEATGIEREEQYIQIARGRLEGTI